MIPPLPDIEFLPDFSSLTAGLREFNPPSYRLRLKNAQRKWEVVSAYQKSVRRGEYELALRAAWAIFTVPKETPYLWRRICVTAAEDIGPANPELVLFIISCAKTYTPKKSQDYLWQVTAYVTQLMCSSPKSRDWCSLSVISSLLGKGEKPPNAVAKFLEASQEAIVEGAQGLNAWVAKNNWRSEAMLQYLLAGELKLESCTGGKIEPPRILMGLPEYAYDMHTRVGKRVCGRLVSHPQVKKVVGLASADRSKVVGWSLFYAEGGLLSNCYRDARIYEAELITVYSKFGLCEEQGRTVIGTLSDLVAGGVVAEIRTSVLSTAGYNYKG